MGGNALKGGLTRRYNAVEFDKITKVIQDNVANKLNTKVYPVPSYKNKESHGDLDLLVLNDGNLPTNMSKFVMDNLVVYPNSEVQQLASKDSSYVLHRNANVYSYLHNDLQVDLILTPTKNWETSKVFFAYNDLGNLMGNVIRKIKDSVESNWNDFVYETPKEQLYEHIRMILNKLD